MPGILAVVEEGQEEIERRRPQGLLARPRLTAGSRAREGDEVLEADGHGDRPERPKAVALDPAPHRAGQRAGVSAEQHFRRRVPELAGEARSSTRSRSPPRPSLSTRCLSPDRLPSSRDPSSSVGWLTFALIRRTIRHGPPPVSTDLAGRRRCHTARRRGAAGGKGVSPLARAAAPAPLARHLGLPRPGRRGRRAARAPILAEPHRQERAAGDVHDARYVRTWRSLPGKASRS